MTNKTVLVTGSSGFVGQNFCKALEYKYSLRTISLQNCDPASIDFTGVDVVLHLGGIAHRMNKTPDNLYFQVNYELTKRLARICKDAGVEHFVFLSTIKVYGDLHEYLTLSTNCHPSDAYGKSKYLAENFLRSIGSEFFKVCIIRSPLIYGPGVKGNLKKLMELVDALRIIPLGEITNSRSILNIDNLIKLLESIIDKKAEGVFLVQDEQPISTTELVRMISIIKGKHIILVKLPKVLRILVKLLLPHYFQRIFGSLEVDDYLTRKEMLYSPPTSTYEGIFKMINYK